MKLIVGLGNPGEKYEKTKHNVGFLYLDYFIKNEKIASGNFSEFKYESKFKGEISTGTIEGEKIILLKPHTYMNLSGDSIKKVVDFYKIELEDIIIIYDDLSMDFGKLRFRDTGSAGGHNGIKDIIRLFTNHFKRIKIGIGFNDNFEVSDWVLSKFNSEELSNLEDVVFPQVYNLIKEKV